MTSTKTYSVAELMERHAKACDLKQVVNRKAIVSAMEQWGREITTHPVTVRFFEDEKEWQTNARDARDARAAWAARDARAAWAARDARAAWAAWAARDARAAWAARAARAAWAAWDAWAASWISVTAIGALENKNIPEFQKWIPVFEAFEAGLFCFYVTADTIWVSTRPEICATDDQRRLHADQGPAFYWLKDVKAYYWHGVNVPEHVIMAPEKITVKEIEGEKNVEVRRVLIERYGKARYLLDSQAKEVQRDDYGILYHKEIPGDEPLVMVKVVNSTAEPDGQYRDYFLRVPANMKTAREAVAWTFGMTAEEYEPIIQT